MSRSKRNIGIIAVCLFLLAGGCYFIRYHYFPRDRSVVLENTDSQEEEKEILRLFDIPVDSFTIIEDVVKPNEMLVSILAKYHIPRKSYVSLISEVHKEFDLRKIRSGNKYTLFIEKDTSATLRYLVYEHSPIEYVRFHFGDSLEIFVGKKEVIQERKYIAGTITTSLWNFLVENQVNPVLAVKLSEIYAWSIDFFGLQPSDSFSVVFDEQYVDTISIGLGKIYAAYFKHAGSDFYAIPFDQDSVESYYDMEGNSLRRSFLKAPLSFSRISSRYSNSRLHPILKIRRPHHGVDYAAPYGTPVVAIGDGRVIMASKGYNKGGGNEIKIRHNSVYTTAYLHLSGFGPGVRAGAYVRQGDIIGYVGTSGLATGPHLDFRFYKNGNPVDPLKVEAPPVEPVHDYLRAEFDSIKAETLCLLSEIPYFSEF